jgi:hypothetical protein
MNASVMFGVGSGNDSVAVLWRDAGRVFCRLSRNDSNAETLAFISAPASVGRPILESANRFTSEHERKNCLDNGWALLSLKSVRECRQMILAVNYAECKPHDCLVRHPADIRRRLSAELSHGIDQPQGLELTRKDTKT